MEPRLEIVLLDAGGGYRVLKYVAALAAELLDARLTVVDRSQPRSVWRAKLGMIRPRRRGATPCLLIAPTPGDLYDCDRVADWSGGFGHVAVFVTDSWVVEWVPRLVRYSRNFDHFFVTQPEDVGPWQKATGKPTGLLAMGADVLRLGSSSGARSVDVQRVGRQPPEWEDDDSNRTAAHREGLRYAGRPPVVEDGVANQRALAKAYANARYTLSFSNGVDRHSYTHHTREYVTFRWLDALSAGAVVAGVAPRCDMASRYFWPGALLELPGIGRTAGLAAIAEARKDWTPDVAARNYREALLRLDWRWQFKEVARHFGLSAPRLDQELEEIERRTSKTPAVA